jgi:ABC-2 type transport system ATP-binding protein
VQTILSIQHIAKAYGPIRALKGVSFDVPKGCVYGILGPNGSGKTTLLGILLDVLKADSGQYQWFGGMQPHDARKRIGALLETPNFYHYLSAVDNLKIAARIKQKGEEDILPVLEKVGLTARKDSKFQTYSLGMKQRLAIASSLLGNPEVLVLDEPTNGLDPAGIAEIRDLILQLQRSGITIVVASHLLDEVEKICSHVAILKQGDLLVNGSVAEVLRSEDVIEVSADDIELLRSALMGMDGVSDIKYINGALQLFVSNSVKASDVNRYAMDKGITLNYLLLKKKSLETKFMEIVNQ